MLQDKPVGRLAAGFAGSGCFQQQGLRLLLGGAASDAVEIVLPKGQQVLMRLEFCRLCDQGAEAGTIKDAGDDPDVTHGALLYSQVSLRPEPGIGFVAGLTAPKGRRMGHAGAIISATGDSAAEKAEIMRSYGLTVAPSPGDFGSTVEQVMRKIAA